DRRSETDIGEFVEPLLRSGQFLCVVSIEMVSAVAASVHHDLDCHDRPPRIAGDKGPQLSIRPNSRTFKSSLQRQGKSRRITRSRTTCINYRARPVGTLGLALTADPHRAMTHCVRGRPRVEATGSSTCSAKSTPMISARP